jgi:Tfp pilus assembly protein PilV
MMKTVMGRSRKRGMTLTEVMMGVAIIMLMGPGLLYGVLKGIRLNYSASQQAAAFNLCLDLLEEMRGVEDFDYVTDAHFPDTTLRLTGLGGLQRAALNCKRKCNIIDHNNPARKEIKIKVDWVYLGKSMQQTLDATIYQRE